MTLHPQGHITCGEPDTLADPIGRRGLVMLPGIGNITVSRLKEGRASLVPGALVAADECLNRRAGCLLLPVGKEWALIPIGAKKGRSPAEEEMRVL